MKKFIGCLFLVLFLVVNMQAQIKVKVGVNYIYILDSKGQEFKGPRKKTEAYQYKDENGIDMVSISGLKKLVKFNIFKPTVTVKFDITNVTDYDDVPLTLEEVIEWIDANTSLTSSSGGVGLTPEQIAALTANTDFRDSLQTEVRDTSVASQYAVSEKAVAVALEVIEEITTTFVTEGVMVDAFPAWEGEHQMNNSQVKILETNVDLNEVDEMVVHFGRDNDTWGTISYAFDPAEIDLDKVQGKLMPHFDNTYLSIDNISSAQFATGSIPFKANAGTGSSYGFTVSKIEFKKRAVVEEGRELLFNAPLNSGSSFVLDNGISWQDVKDRYESIHYIPVINNHAYTGSTSTSSLATGQNIAVPLNQINHFVISSIDLSDGEAMFQTVNNATDASSFQIWGVLPHGRVSGVGQTSKVQYSAYSGVDDTNVDAGEYMQWDDMVGISIPFIDTDNITFNSSSPYNPIITKDGLYEIEVGFSVDYESGAADGYCYNLILDGITVDRQCASNSPTTGLTNSYMTLKYFGPLTTTSVIGAEADQLSTNNKITINNMRMTIIEQ